MPHAVNLGPTFNVVSPGVCLRSLILPHPFKLCSVLQ